MGEHRHFWRWGAFWNGAMKSRRRGLVGAILSAVAATNLVAMPVSAQPSGSIPLVRDAETEGLLRDYLSPILKAAGLPGGTTEVVLINRRDFNAFVVDSRRIFINVGVITASETPNEVIGVLAHETGHIAGGHLVRMRDAMAKAQLMAAIGMMLGIGAMVAGAGTGSGEMGQAGIGVAGAGMQTAQRSFLAYQRGEEESADRAALKYLDKTKQSAKGMIRVFERFADQQLLSARFADPYAQSHPMPRDRIAQLEERARKSPYFDAVDPPALQARHDLVRAKLIAFTEAPASIVRRYPATDQSLPAHYARAVLAHRIRDPQSAQRELDALIKAQPTNAFFWELKGQALLETGRPKEAIAALRKAVALAPNAPLIRTMLGEAMVATGDRSLADEAVGQLNRGLATDSLGGMSYRQLATAYAQRGEIGMADLATARGLMAEGNIDAARRYAARAQTKLKPGSPAWLQADDIVSYKPAKP
jgi:predicted Zn-dependent protease